MLPICRTTFWSVIADVTLLLRKRYTFTSQKVYSCNAKGVQLPRKRYTVAAQKVYSCNTKGIQLRCWRFLPCQVCRTWTNLKNKKQWKIVIARLQLPMELWCLSDGAAFASKLAVCPVTSTPPLRGRSLPMAKIALHKIALTRIK